MKCIAKWYKPWANDFLDQMEKLTRYKIFWPSCNLFVTYLCSKPNNLSQQARPFFPYWRHHWRSRPYQWTVFPSDHDWGDAVCMGTTTLSHWHNVRGETDIRLPSNKMSGWTQHTVGVEHLCPFEPWILITWNITILARHVIVLGC